MEFNQFTRLVVERAGLASEAEALRAIDATLATLSERLAGEEPAHIAAQLPGPIKPFLSSPGRAEDFDVETFFNRVAKREGLPSEQAGRHARAVMATVAEAVTGGEAADIMAQLPVEYSRLFIVGGDFLSNPENWTA
jgi:uncharacterized protein (DUF2267 family)